MAKYFNNNVKYLRTQKKISQDELANATGIERSVLSRIENDKIETSLENAYKLSAYFNIPIEEMVCDNLTVKKDIFLDENHKLETIIMDKSKELTEQDKKKLINIIDSVFDNK